MAKGLAKRAMEQKRKDQAAGRARQRAFLPRRHNHRDIEYSSTFLDLARELRDMVYVPLLTSLTGPVVWLSNSYANLSPSRWSQEVLGDFLQVSFVNKQVALEAKDIMIKNDDFALYFNLAKVQWGDIRLARAFMPGQSASLVSHLTSVTIMDHIMLDFKSTDYDQKLHDRMMRRKWGDRLDTSTTSKV